MVRFLPTYRFIDLKKTILQTLLSTEEANSELGVPYGAYIKEVEMDSPAMLAGIQQVDVITGFGERVIISFDEYTNSLLSMKPGDSVELTIMRQSQQEYKEMKFDITLTVLK